MAKRILVPLDRSEASRSVLPMVADMARGSGGTVRLLHVARIPTERVSDDGRVVAYVNQEMERIEYSRLDYLKEAEAGLEGVPVESVVRFGDPAEEIVREADAFARLILRARAAKQIKHAVVVLIRDAAAIVFNSNVDLAAEFISNIDLDVERAGPIAIFHRIIKEITEDLIECQAVRNNRRNASIDRK